ncbi:MAG: hypothetical protein GYB40_11880 [Vibrionaceae bacterium]|nr:hypothetical protein [Vibrionaceae bacterium]
MKLSKVVILVSTLLYSFCASAVSQRLIDDPAIVGELYYTEGRLNQPVIMILGGSGGGDFVKKYAVVRVSVNELVSKGYAVLSLSYFDQESQSSRIPASLKRVPLEYFEQAFNWVQTQPDLKKNSIAVYGTSRGGELALLLASKFEFVDLVVAAVPSAYVWSSYDRYRTDDEYLNLIKIDPCQSAWTWNGKDIPNICLKYYANYTPWHNVIENKRLVEKFSIPVENSSAAILLTSALYDTVWPSTEMSNRIISKLQNAQYAYPFKHISYHDNHFVHTRSWPDVLEFIEFHYPFQ